jgi:tetratricopeptide (TPR) repeat protein
MRRGPHAVAFLAGAALGIAFGLTACSAQLDDARTAYRTGKYDDAIAIYRRAADRDPTSVEAWQGLARSLSMVGQYGDAEQALKRAPAELAAALANTLGDVLTQQGKVPEAEAAYRTAVQQRAADSLSARLNLALLRYGRGEHSPALDEFDSFIDVYNRGRLLTSEELVAVGTAVRYLGVRDQQLFQDAVKAFGEAVARDAANQEARLRSGELFLEKYQSDEAQKDFQEVLRENPTHPRALLGLARAKEFDGSAEALGLAQQALSVNPSLVGARVLIARAALTTENPRASREAAEAALKVNPNALDALTALAAAQYFGGDAAGFSRTRDRILQLNPRYADLYVTLADLSVQNRRYSEAVEFARQAVALDSTSWRAHGVLGINLMRLGDIAAGRQSLETAFRGDPYNPWFKNTLDLLDTMARFREVEAGRFRIAADPREADLLVPYVSELADDAYQKLSARYQMQLEGSVRIELFFSHADFSVRTVGLAGLGALGAAFGNVLVLDSPSAREAGSFNWGSTLWHELAHAFHLALSDHRVPRWLTEGLAVLEERRARPGWGDDIQPGFVAAYKQDKLLPVSELSKGFVRPAFPEQIGFSYYQASLVAELIERDHGFPAIIDMLRAYRAGQTTDQVMRAVLKTEPAAFDKKFDAYMRERFARHIAAVKATEQREPTSEDMGDYAVQLILAQRLIREQKFDEALPVLQRAKALFPEYAGGDSPYALLARIYREKGDLQKAAAELDAMTRLNETDYEANLALADILESTGNAAGAAAALDRAIYIYPMQPALHSRLAELYKKSGDLRKVVRERQALLALNPVDRAEAYYQLALAHFEAGDAAAARREVLQALEEAPSFEKAQELLLRLRGGRQ